MFSSFGWGEFFFILILGLIIIGPEKLPSVLEDVRAAIYAARKGIANAKRELNGEMEDLEEFRKPIDTMTKYASMGPARAMSSLLFDGDEEYLQSFDPRRVLEDDDAAGPAGTGQVPSGPRPAAGGRGSTAQRPGPAQDPGRGGQPHGRSQLNQPQYKQPPRAGGSAGGGSTRRGGGFSWEDVT